MTNFSEWMLKASPAEKAELARRACTTRRYLYKLATGQKSPSEALAKRLERAARMLGMGAPDRLPRVASFTFPKP